VDGFWSAMPIAVVPARAWSCVLEIASRLQRAKAQIHRLAAYNRLRFPWLACGREILHMRIAGYAPNWRRIPNYCGVFSWGNCRGQMSTCSGIKAMVTLTENQ
jgi:hypothetical protein